MADKDRFSLDDLNELSGGLGNRICSLLDSYQGQNANLYRFQQAKKEIKKMLAAHKLETDDVFVNRGSAEGLTISTAFQNAASFFQFQDQFDV